MHRCDSDRPHHRKSIGHTIGFLASTVFSRFQRTHGECPGLFVQEHLRAEVLGVEPGQDEGRAADRQADPGGHRGPAGRRRRRGPAQSFQVLRPGPVRHADLWRDGCWNREVRSPPPRLSFSSPLLLLASPSPRFSFSSLLLASPSPSPRFSFSSLLLLLLLASILLASQIVVLSSQLSFSSPKPFRQATC